MRKRRREYKTEEEYLKAQEFRFSIASFYSSTSKRGRKRNLENREENARKNQASKILDNILKELT